MTIDNQFIQHYEPMLRRLARQYATHLKQCPALEEKDLVQEAWLAIIQLPDSAVSPPPTGGTEGGYSAETEQIQRIASSAMQDAIRRYSIKSVPLQEDHAIELPDNLPEGNPTEQWRAIQRAAEALSPHEKQLMDMLLKRIPRQEMATRMNIPHATLRQQIKRLRHKLRKACPTIIR